MLAGLLSLTILMPMMLGGVDRHPDLYFPYWSSASNFYGRLVVYNNGTIKKTYTGPNFRTGTVDLFYNTFEYNGNIHVANGNTIYRVDLTGSTYTITDVSSSFPFKALLLGLHSSSTNANIRGLDWDGSDFYISGWYTTPSGSNSTSYYVSARVPGDFSTITVFRTYLSLIIPGFGGPTQTLSQVSVCGDNVYQLIESHRTDIGDRIEVFDKDSTGALLNDDLIYQLELDDLGIAEPRHTLGAHCFGEDIYIVSDDDFSTAMPYNVDRYDLESSSVLSSFDLPTQFDDGNFIYNVSAFTLK